MWSKGKRWKNSAPVIDLFGESPCTCMRLMSLPGHRPHKQTAWRCHTTPKRITEQQLTFRTFLKPTVRTTSAVNVSDAELRTSHSGALMAPIAAATPTKPNQ
jgi:hypothetical protein